MSIHSSSRKSFEPSDLSDELYSNPPSGDFLDELLSVGFGTGRDRLSINKEKYVVHLQSIPFAHVADTVHAERKNPSSHFLNHEDSGDTSTCARGNCMFSNTHNRNRYEVVPENCPCQEKKGLIPICFLQALRSFGRLYSSKIPKLIEPSEIMFCFKYTGIFDLSYGKIMRDATGITGWSHVTNMDRLVSVLRQCYWFSQSKANEQVLTYVERPFNVVKSAVKQSIHTINGLLVKLMLAFPAEIPGYRAISLFTKNCFVSLMKSYLGNDSESSPILDLKKFGKFVKANFHRSPSARMEILSYKFEYECFNLVEKLLARYKSDLEILGIEHKPLESIGWIYRMGILSQNRNLGYLPQSVAEKLRLEYRERLNSPDRVPSKEDLSVVYHSILVALEDNLGDLTLKVKDFREEIYSSIEMPIKLTASVDHTLHEGGKLEDARLILNEFIDDKLTVPIYDLDTGVKTGDLSYSEGPFSSALFWYSMNSAISYFTESKQLRGFHPVKTRRDAKHFFDTEIVHVSEPAKERNLTKSTAELAWLLTPAGKLIQSVLAKLPEHKVGLTGTDHGWDHQKEWGPSGERNSFLYDSEGYLQKNVLSFFQDWTESTDYINRYHALAMLRSLFEFVEFPKFYALLVMMIIKQPQPVREVTSLFRMDEDEKFQKEKIVWNGSIRKGLMMGNPITKGVLHMLHIVELEYGKTILGGLGFVAKDATQYLLPKKRIEISPEKFAEMKTGEPQKVRRC